MSEPPLDAGPESPLAWAAAVVGDRWSLLLVEALLPGGRRFTELLEAVPGVATNVLADRLRRLERDGVLLALPYSARPPRHRYELTARGRDLADALRLLAQWGSASADREIVAHDLCGTPLRVAWWCPTCERQVDESEPGPPFV